MRAIKITSLILFFTFIIFFWAVFVPKILFAAGSFKDDLSKQADAFAGEYGAGIETQTDVRIVAMQIVGYLLGLTGTIFLIYTIYAGYLILTSAGDSERVEKGKKILRYSIIGVLVALSSYGILWFVSNFQYLTQEEPENPEDVFDFNFDADKYNPCSYGRGDAQSCAR